MKYIIALVLLHIIVFNLSAQKVVEKHVNLSSNGSVNLNIQIADSITIRTWNKKEAYVKATVNVNDNKNNDDYKWNFNEAGGGLSVDAKLDFGKTRSNNCNCNCKTQVNCIVYIPENTNLNVETINGNITITGQTAETKAKSISGFVDMSVSPKRAAEVSFNTITGTMYSDFDFDKEDKNMRRVAGTSISSSLNGGGSNSIHLETISGDIYFHKS